MAIEEQLEVRNVGSDVHTGESGDRRKAKWCRDLCGQEGDVLGLPPRRASGASVSSFSGFWSPAAGFEERTGRQSARAGSE